MPLYDTECRKCAFAWEQSHMMRESHEACPKCGTADVFTVLQPTHVRPSLDASWEGENQGSGRYFPQFEDSVDCTKSRKNCFRSRREAIEEGKRRGFVFLEK